MVERDDENMHVQMLNGLTWSTCAYTKHNLVHLCHCIQDGATWPMNSALLRTHQFVKSCNYTLINVYL